MDSYDNVAEKRALVSCCCWEELPNGPLLEIALRLSNFEDFMILHLVCTRWNSVLRSFRCKFGDYHQAACCAPQVPWLMMVQRKAFQIDEQLRALPLFFYTLSFRKVHGLPVTFPPQLQHDDFNECCLHSSHGWLLVTNKGTGCCTMSLYNPFSSSTNNYIPLPGFDTFARPSRFALSASPCTTSYTVMITRHDGNVAFWRPGGKGWTIVGPQHTVNLSDVTFYRGHYYALNWLGSLCRICKRKNLAGEEYWFWNRLCGLLPRNTDNKFIWKAYFVVLEEQLLVAIRVSRFPKVHHLLHVEYDYLTAAFQVLEIVICPKQVIPLVKEVKSLGNKSLFVGGNQAFAIEVPQEASRYYGCKPNCIYFTDDRNCQRFPGKNGRGTDMGVYNMADGSIERDFQGISLDNFSPLLWIEPRC